MHIKVIANTWLTLFFPRTFPKEAFEAYHRRWRIVRFMRIFVSFNISSPFSVTDVQVECDEIVENRFDCVFHLHTQRS